MGSKCLRRSRKSGGDRFPAPSQCGGLGAVSRRDYDRRRIDCLAVVSRPISCGGLGFSYKWNMGWMHDTLDYIDPRSDPSPLSSSRHDIRATRCIHGKLRPAAVPRRGRYGKGSLISKMPGDRWQRFANLRAYFGFMWSHPGKKLLFMGGEFAQEREWHHDRELDWRSLDPSQHMPAVPVGRGVVAMATFHFELVSPDKMLFNGSAQAVLVPGTEGDFQVLSDHAPVMTSMRPGVVGIDDAEGKHTRVFVRGGFAERQQGLILLAETAIPFETSAPTSSARRSRTPRRTSPTRARTRSAWPRRSSTACASSRTRSSFESARSSSRVLLPPGSSRA